MAPGKKQKGASASASKPVRKNFDLAWQNAVAHRASNVSQRRLPGSKKADKPVRAEKKLINKAEHAKAVKEIKPLIVAAIEAGKKKGSAAVAQSLAINGPYKEVPPAATGRPREHPYVEWSAALGEELYVLMSTGHSMEAASKVDGMPSLFQMIRWLADENHPFSNVRARAVKNLVPYYEELAKDIAMTANRYTIVTRKQVVTRDGDIEDLVEKREVDNVERSKLAVSTLMWTLSHLLPKKHGRTPDISSDAPNAQLEGLFAALKAGPKE